MLEIWLALLERTAFGIQASVPCGILPNWERVVYCRATGTFFLSHALHSLLDLHSSPAEFSLELLTGIDSTYLDDGLYDAQEELEAKYATLMLASLRSLETRGRGVHCHHFAGPTKTMQLAGTNADPTLIPSANHRPAVTYRRHLLNFYQFTCTCACNIR
jgi:hypothetical protein